MSKAVAIPYLVAIVIGLIILVIMSYLLYKVYVTKKLPAEACRSEFMKWCSMCSNTGWKSSLTISQQLVDNCKDVLLEQMGFDISDYSTPDPVGNTGCAHSDAKRDCCTVGVKNEMCSG